MGNALNYIDPGLSQLHHYATGKQWNGDPAGPKNARSFLDPSGSVLKDPNAKTQAQKDAEAAEAARQAAMGDAKSQINAIYDSPDRQKQYDDFINAVRENYRTDADRQKTIADRNLKFSLARGGLTHGSADVDARRTLGEEYTKGILTSENKAQSALAGLKAQDSQSRLNLIGLAQTGLDATSAVQRAGEQMQASAQGAQSDAALKGLGDIFGATADTYKRQQEAAQLRKGQLAPVGTLYGKGF